MVPPINPDPTGNTILHTRSLSLRVSSKSLSLASPGFATLFANAPVSVSLYDDDPSALTIIANIFHFKTSEKDVPRADIYTPLLHNLALVCHKYQCIPSLGPWVDIWLSSFDKAKTDANARYWKEWLVVGEIFGRPQIVAWASEKAAIMGTVEDLEACSASVGDKKAVRTSASRLSPFFVFVFPSPYSSFVSSQPFFPSFPLSCLALPFLVSQTQPNSLQ